MKPTIIILGGNSPRNAAWAAQLASALSQYADTHLQTYLHWDRNQGEINFTEELQRLTDYTSTKADDYYIVAKSAGGLLALQGIAKKVLEPKALICVGLPLTYAQQRKISLQKIVSSNTLPTLYIQAEQDPVGTSQEVAALVTHHGELVSVKGDNHDYEDIIELVKLVIKFVPLPATYFDT